MLRIAICEDVSEQAEELSITVEKILHRTQENLSFKIERYTMAADLLETVKVCPYDIVFLDIHLSEADGVETASALNECAPLTQIIFISAYLEYVRRIYDARHLYFLAKPIDPARLEEALTKAVQAVGERQDGHLLLKLSSGVSRVLLFSELCYGERTGRVTTLHLASGEIVTISMTVRELLAMLPPEHFASPHNSFFVQLARVRAFDRHSLKMNDGAMIPISNMRRQSFQTALEDYLK